MVPVRAFNILTLFITFASSMQSLTGSDYDDEYSLDENLLMPMEVGSKAAVIGSAIPMAASAGGAVLGSLGTAPLVIGSVAAPPVAGLEKAGVMSMYHIAKSMSDKEDHQKFNAAVSRGFSGFKNGLSETGKFLLRPFAALIGSKLYLLGLGGNAASQARNKLFGGNEQSGLGLKAAGSSMIRWAVKGTTNVTEGEDYDKVDGNLGSFANNFVTDYHGTRVREEAAFEMNSSRNGTAPGKSEATEFQNRTLETSNITLGNESLTTKAFDMQNASVITTDNNVTAATEFLNRTLLETGNITLGNESLTTKSFGMQNASVIMTDNNVTAATTTVESVTQTLNNTRTRRGMTVNLQQALDLIEAQDLKACVARVTCELSCKRDSLKERGKNVYQNLQKISESNMKGPLEIRIKYYKEAEDFGIQNRPTCVNCHKKYPRCKHKTSRLLQMIEAVDVV